MFIMTFSLIRMEKLLFLMCWTAIVTLKLAYRGLLLEQTAGGNDVESSTFEQVCEFIRQALVSLEEIRTA